MAIDTHTHAVSGCTDESIAECFRITGVDKILLAALPKERVRGGAHNEECARIRERFPDRVVPLIGIHPPDVDQSLREIEQYHKRGFAGIKLMPTSGLYYPHDDKHRRVFEEVNARKMIVLSHCGWCAPAGQPDLPQCTLYSHPYYFEPLIRVFTDTDFIFAHAGGRTMYQAAFELVRYHENAWTDCCPGNGTWVLKFAGKEWLDVLNWDRLLFGTDTVYGDLGSARHFAEREQVIRSAIDKAGYGDRYANVKHGNAARLFKKHGIGA